MSEPDYDRLIRQNRTKWRIIAQREIRAHLAGKGDGILYATGDRMKRDLIRLAFEAGRRAAAECACCGKVHTSADDPCGAGS